MKKSKTLKNGKGARAKTDCPYDCDMLFAAGDWNPSWGDPNAPFEKMQTSTHYRIAAVMRQWLKHPNCLYSRAAWDSYTDRPFDSSEAIRWMFDAHGATQVYVRFYKDGNERLIALLHHYSCSDQVRNDLSFRGCSFTLASIEKNGTWQKLASDALHEMAMQNGITFDNMADIITLAGGSHLVSERLSKLGVLPPPNKVTDGPFQ